MVLTGLPWGYPRATWAHILSIHRFLQIRLNKDPVGHIELCIKYHAKTHRMMLSRRTYPTIRMLNKRRIV